MKFESTFVEFVVDEIWTDTKELFYALLAREMDPL